MWVKSLGGEGGYPVLSGSRWIVCPFICSCGICGEFFFDQARLSIPVENKVALLL